MHYGNMTTIFIPHATAPCGLLGMYARILHESWTRWIYTKMVREIAERSSTQTRSDWRAHVDTQPDLLLLLRAPAVVNTLQSPVHTAYKSGSIKDKAWDLGYRAIEQSHLALLICLRRCSGVVHNVIGSTYSR